MRIKNNISLRGDLTIRIRDVLSNGILKTMTLRNQITDVGLSVLVQLLSQRDGDNNAASLKLAELWVGTGTAPAVKTDTGLANPPPGFRAKIPLVDETKTPNLLGPFELQILATLPSSSPANGFHLTEAGLYTAGDVNHLPFPIDQRLFARRVHADIHKVAEISIDYDWRIRFTA